MSGDGISRIPFENLFDRFSCRSDLLSVLVCRHSMQHVETILTKYVSLTRALAQSAMAKLENAGSDFSGLV